MTVTARKPNSIYLISRRADSSNMLLGGIPADDKDPAGTTCIDRTSR